PGPYDLFYHPYRGWAVALWGWLGPFALAPGWYANIPFAISLSRGLRNQPPGRWSVLTGIVLALTALMPFWYSDFEFGGGGWHVLRGPALWLWLGACAFIWLPASSDERLFPQTSSH